jgi:DNA-directed RNA polymerase specialized sigma24 family protein
MKSYLYRLVINKTNEFLRKKISGEVRLKEYMQLRAEQVQTDEQTQDLLIRDEMDKVVGLVQEYLSRKESEAILLRYKYHYDNEEAARQMNVQKETLIRYVSIGLRKMRDIMKGRERADND